MQKEKLENLSDDIISGKGWPQRFSSPLEMKNSRKYYIMLMKMHSMIFDTRHEANEG